MSAGKRIIEGLEEAIRFARGEETGARATIVEIPDALAIRKKLGMTQEEFSARFAVKIGTLRNWEQGVRVPEGPARVLLTIIEREPEAVRRALAVARPKRVSAKTARSRGVAAKRSKPGA